MPARKATRKTKSKRRSYHHGDLRNALLEAAAELVEQLGPEGVSVREAARRAGVSAGAPFRHFADKRALMHALAQEGMQRLIAELARATATAGDSPAMQLRAMGIAFVRFAVAHPSHFRVMHVPEYAGPALRREAEAMRGAMRGLVAAAQQQGAIAPGDPDLVVLGCHALVYGIARMFVDGLFAVEGIGNDRAEAIAEALTELFGRGLVEPRA